MTKRKPSKAARIRELHAAGVDRAEIMRRTKSTREAVDRAIAYKPTGERRGPKTPPKCTHCGGTGYEPEAEPSSVVIGGKRIRIDSDAGVRRAFAAMRSAGLRETVIMDGDHETSARMRIEG